MIVDETSRRFKKIFELACFSGFLVGRESAIRMLKYKEETNTNDKFTIIYTGATASLRGKQNFSAFATAKSGLRAFVQSLARELQPNGIHVAHVIVDGIVNNPNTIKYFGGFEGLKKEQFIQPDDIANQYYNLYLQKLNCLTFEMDVRPHLENF